MIKQHPLRIFNKAGDPPAPQNKHWYSLKASGDPRAAGARFLDALQLFTRLVNIGDAKSLATHPASTTHRQLNDEELAKAGVKPDMVRLSIGIEHIDDILADIEQALAAA